MLTPCALVIFSVLQVPAPQRPELPQGAVSTGRETVGATRSHDQGGKAAGRIGAEGPVTLAR